MSDFVVIDTQEKFDAAIEERIKQERKTVEQQYGGYLSPGDVEKKYNGYLSPEDAEKKYAGYISPEESKKKDALIQEYEKKALKTKVAIETGIPYEMAMKLSGDDEEAIRKDAETMAKYFKGGRTLPLADPEEPIADRKKTAIKKMLAGLKGE